jgi:DNA-binding SARP family transcriptional activator
VDDSELRPRARALLAILALRHPVPVHVDVLIDSLWPDADYDAAAHRMQTAVSSLRRLLQHEAMSEASAGDLPNIVVRRGSAYVLQHARTDLDEFQVEERNAGVARREGDDGREVAALRRLLSLCTGDLLSEFGPAEWLVRERDRLRLAAADAAERLVELELAAGNLSAAMSVARHGLTLDCYRESLWRLAESTAERMADPAAAARVRAQRIEALSELDLCID